MCSLKWKTKDDERGNDTHWDIVYAFQSSLCSVNNLIFDKTRMEQIQNHIPVLLFTYWIRAIHHYYLVIWFILVINLFHKLGLDH